jgi:predicted secreted protein
MTASAAISGYGTLLQISDGVSSPTTGWTSIAEVVNIGATLSRTSIEVTHLDSPDAWKEFIAGLAEAEVTLGLNFLTSNATQVALIATTTTNTPADVKKLYRILLPDYGITSYTATVVAATDVWTASGSHGWQTGQRIKVSTAGTMPANVYGLTSGQTIYIGRASATTFKMYPTSADAVASTNALDFTTTGSGTHTVTGGSWLQFYANITSGPNPQFSANDRVSASFNLKVTGQATFNP